MLPPEAVVGLREGPDTIEVIRATRRFEFDLVTARCPQVLRSAAAKNGYVLEQLTSPLIVRTSPEHEELKHLVGGIVTRHHAHHYLGFAATQWQLFGKEPPRRVKPLLYVYRVLSTGIHLMRTGEIEANLATLNQNFGLPHVPELIARKVAGAEQSTLSDADWAFHESEYVRLVALLEEAAATCSLPEAPTAGAALHDLLVRIRLGGSRL